MVKLIVKWSVVACIIATGAWLYKNHNPADNAYFPKCPFKTITGYKCPGCGSQRAVHHLLNLDIRQAAANNAVLVLSIPYILVGVGFGLLKNPTDGTLKWRKRLYGKNAIYVVLILILSFWILRNISVFTCMNN
ncbi:MAG: DUF2752 domain-containing protein [Prevotellaceae bacterium]|jgi:hypothetical protein|nr:DUF2752 domain-containing protein [Prevotellaceae bacterium]